MHKKGKGIKKYKLVVTEQLWGCNIQHREYSQQYSNNCMVSDGSEIYLDDHLVSNIMSNHQGITPETNITLYVNYNCKI